MAAASSPSATSKSLLIITKSNSATCRISPSAPATRRAITSSLSEPRARRRRSSYAIDGGRMKMVTASGNCLRICCAPCQSISSSMSQPSCMRCSSHTREVP